MADTLQFHPTNYFDPDRLKRETGWNFRNFDMSKRSQDPKIQMIYDTYRGMHKNQTVEYVRQRKEHWCRFDRFRATVMEVLEQLNTFVDESDPDVDIPNYVHAFQVAERIRQEHPTLDWLHLTGLLHDVGKVMALHGEPQFSTVGDTYPVGCQFQKSIVFYDSTFEANPDIENKNFNTKYGLYEPNCGLDNVVMLWGHDEYLYRVLKENGTTLPEEALYIIRYHSFYPWHTENDYTYLTNDYDKEMLLWVKEFNKFDLYTKKENICDLENVKPYYNKLIDKYLPGILRW